MSDRDALYAAVCANPDDDTARLVFADWLDEHGDALCRAVPVRALAFDNLTAAEGVALGRSGILRRVRALRFGVDVSDTKTYSGLREIGAHPDAEAIRTLTVAYPPAPAEMVEAV